MKVCYFRPTNVAVAAVAFFRHLSHKRNPAKRESNTINLWRIASWRRLLFAVVQQRLHGERLCGGVVPSGRGGYQRLIFYLHPKYAYVLAKF